MTEVEPIAEGTEGSTRVRRIEVTKPVNEITTTSRGEKIVARSVQLTFSCWQHHGGLPVGVLASLKVDKADADEAVMVAVHGRTCAGSSPMSRDEFESTVRRGSAVDRYRRRPIPACPAGTSPTS